MNKLKRAKKILIAELLILGLIGILSFSQKREEAKAFLTANENYIKWVDFKISTEALEKAYEIDMETYKKEPHLRWTEMLAFLGAKHGGEFPKESCRELKKLKEDIYEGKTTLQKVTKDMKYYSYYLEAYEAVLGGYLGEIEVQTSEKDGKPVFEKKYGLKVFSPIAKGFPYQDYSDFGASRSYGYKREHLGHDMMGQIGTPIVAVESGYIEALGWNTYGGWRIGIRSFDEKRYYYYAHLRQNFPYCKALKEGSVVTAGDVIGYMGHTGYSRQENVNNIKTVHLHLGMQLIFDESQKEGNGEIWIDCYPLTQFLYRNRMETKKIEASKEWVRTYATKDPLVADYLKQKSKLQTGEK